MFGFGGGYAMLSLIQYEVVDHHHWLTLQQFTDVVAISQMTPGPIGINSATYVGYAVTQSVWGAVVTTIAVCLPSFILVLLISYFFVKCKDNKYIKAAMSGLLPMSVSLIADEQGKFHRLQKHTYLCSRFRRDVEVEPPPYLTDNPCRSRRLPSILKKR